MSETEEKYLLYNIREARAGWNDSCILWWAPNSAGYRQAVDEAGRYSLELATSICSHGEVRMVKESEVLKVSKTHTYCWLDDLVPKRGPVNTGTPPKPRKKTRV